MSNCTKDIQKKETTKKKLAMPTKKKKTAKQTKLFSFIFNPEKLL